MGNGANIKVLDRSFVNSEVNDLGLYEILDDDQDVLYVGSGPLRSTLSEHLPGGEMEMDGARYYRTYGCSDGRTIEVRKRSLISDYEYILGVLPKYNGKKT